MGEVIPFPQELAQAYAPETEHSHAMQALGMHSALPDTTEVDGGSGRLEGELIAGTRVEGLALSILDILPFYLMLVDADHRILLANHAARRDLGLNSDLIIGQYCHKVVHGLDRPFPGCPLEEAIDEGHTVERELCDPCYGRWFASAIYPTGCSTRGDRPIFLHVIRDITEQKRAEEALQNATMEMLLAFSTLVGALKSPVLVPSPPFQAWGQPDHR